MLPLIKQPILEALSKILGDCNSGSQITTYLNQVGVDDVDGFGATKWKRLYDSFATYQNDTQSSEKIFNYICLVCAPSRFVNNEDEYFKLLSQINLQLSFCGIKLNENGTLQSTKQAETISEAQQRANNLKEKLEKRNAHSAIFIYCKAELLQNNYFHAVFEAMKGLMQRIRDLSGSSLDGTKLVEYIFSSNPVLIINNFQSQSERDEHTGFCNLLKGLCSMFRNTESHEPKIYWTVTEQDALEILGMISYCHRRLDKAQKIRLIEN